MTSNQYDKETIKTIIRNEIEQMAEDGSLHAQSQGETDEVEQMATSAFVARDLRQSEDYSSNAEYLCEEYGIDAEEYDDVEELQAAVSSARSEQREQQVGHTLGRGA